MISILPWMSEQNLKLTCLVFLVHVPNVECLIFYRPSVATPRRNGFATQSTSTASFEDLHLFQRNREVWARDTDIARPTADLAGPAGSDATPSPSGANVKSTSTVLFQWLYLGRVVRLFNTSTWANLQIIALLIFKFYRINTCH